MKNLFLLAFLAAFFFGCNSGESKDSNENNDKSTEQSGSSSGKIYEIESGYYVYKTTIMGVDSKSTTFFKDYGNIEASVVEVEMMGQKISTNTLRKDNYFYSYNDGEKEGTKMKIDEKTLATEGEIGKIDEKAIEAMGGKKVANETILGRECTVFEVNTNNAKAKYWIWKNLLVKMEASQDQTEVTMEAVEIKETSDFPEGIFDVPQDIQFKEIDLGSESDFDQEDAKG